MPSQPWIQRASDASKLQQMNSGLFEESETSSVLGENIGKHANPGETVALAKKEERAVQLLRVVVVIVLTCAALCVSLFVYFYTKMDESEEFETRFYNLGTRLVEGFHENAKLRLQVLDMLSVSITSYALASGSTWPFVTIPDFEARASAARAMTESSYLGLYPHITNQTRSQWEEYSIDNLGWLNQSLAYHNDFESKHGRSARSLSLDYFSRHQNSNHRFLSDEANTTSSIKNVTFELGYSPDIYRWGAGEGEGEYVVEDSPGPFYPMWQLSPAREEAVYWVNYNVNDPYYPGAYVDALEYVLGEKTAVFAGVWNVDDDGYINNDDDYDLREVPVAGILYPVFDNLIGDTNVVAVLDLDLEFGAYFRSVLPADSDEIICVIHNPCGQAFSYGVNGGTATYLGPEDYHDEAFDAVIVSAPLAEITLDEFYNGVPINKDYCPWFLDVYPTRTFHDSYITDRPIYYTVAVFGVFLVSCLVFLGYDCCVQRRQRVVMTTAVQSSSIVSSLFPKDFHDRLYQENDKTKSERGLSESPLNLDFMKPEALWKGVNDTHSNGRNNDHPIAELYPHCTVLFADIAGFTAWSSARDPLQVFTLLESMYSTMDSIALKHSVFKIETIGDCYVAVTGLPVEQPNHALLMTRFARDCLVKISTLTSTLEIRLGPGTSDLSIRIGLHSGPVTAGILRGVKSRFQLFGDTVNTAARLESSGAANRIHVSEETACLLVNAGKSAWVHRRGDKVVAKGKGEMQTFWVIPTPGGSSISQDHAVENDIAVDIDSTAVLSSDARALKRQRRVDWIVDLFLEHLELIITSRKTSFGTAVTTEDIWKLEACRNSNAETVRDELNDTIFIPAPGDTGKQKRSNTGIITQNVKSQVREFVERIAAMYQDNPFHNFEHACQVLMSTNKMLKQVKTVGTDSAEVESYGFASDPLARFTILLCALIHDVEHAGVTNRQLVLEDTNVAARYRNESVLEQHSVDVAWSLLMEANFRDLRSCLCVTKKEFKRFRQLIVNLVIATDIFDKELIAQRKNRWAKAFGRTAGPVAATAHYKSTIVMEFVIQASDVAHTMQHWTNYIKWNKRLFEEMYLAYKNGRHETDPSTGWYEGELNFFDNYIIPLAEKLEECTVFGASSSQYLNYAKQNRLEWESKGKRIVQTMVAEFGCHEEKALEGGNTV